MDATLFDSLTRSLRTARSRRGAFSGLLLGTLGGLGWMDPRDAAAKNCKKIKDKKRRKQCKQKAKEATACRPSCAGKGCGDDGCGNVCGFCAGGQTCQSGVCVCPVGQEVSGGVCATRPTCAGFNDSCDFRSDCCSAVCNNSRCLCSQVGEACDDTSDCCFNPPGLVCVGFVCVGS